MNQFKKHIFDLVGQEIQRHPMLRIFVFSGTPCVDWSSLGSSNGLQRHRQGTKINRFQDLSSEHRHTLESCFESSNIGENGVWGFVKEHRHILERVRAKNNVPREKEENANYQLLQMLEIFGQLIVEYPDNKVEFCFENGDGTYMWAAIDELLERSSQTRSIVGDDFADYLGMFANNDSIRYITTALDSMKAVNGASDSIVCDCCRFGALWQKYTRFGTNSVEIVKEFQHKYWTCENGGFCQDDHISVCALAGSLTAGDTSAYPTRFCQHFAKVVMDGSTAGSRSDESLSSDSSSSSSSSLSTLSSGSSASSSSSSLSSSWLSTSLSSFSSSGSSSGSSSSSSSSTCCTSSASSLSLMATKQDNSDSSNNNDKGSGSGSSMQHTFCRRSEDETEREDEDEDEDVGLKTTKRSRVMMESVLSDAGSGSDDSDFCVILN